MINENRSKGLSIVESQLVLCAICGETAKRVGEEYECPTCKEIFWTSPQKQICSKCGGLFLDFGSIAGKLQNWIGTINRGLWKSRLDMLNTLIRLIRTEKKNKTIKQKDVY